MKRKTLILGLVGAVMVLLLYATEAVSQQSLRVRVDRWLELQQSQGTVLREQGNRSQPARVGDRLQAVGDAFITGKNSSATLLVDTGIGFISMAEQTKIRVQALEVAPDNGRITRLQVTQGQVRLKVRRFTHQGSQLEIRTPASLSGVRGTEFGVSTQPNGKTGLAVRQGRVASSARGQAVAVGGGFQNFTIPGEPPSPPVPLRNDTHLKYEFQKSIEAGVRRIRLIGQVDPVNRVVVEGREQTTDRNGRFSTDLKFVPSYFKIQVVVTTPLGKKQVYELALR